jgi:AraC-like DNA-binding protein
MHNLVNQIELRNIHSTVAGSIVYPPGGRFGPRIQIDYQLVLLHTGEMEVTIDDMPFQIQSGHVAMLKPGHQEQFVFARNKETWHRWIAIHITDLLEEQSNYLNEFPFSIPISEDLNRLTDLLLSLRSKNTDTSEIIRSLGLAALHLYESEKSQNRQQEIHPSVESAKSFIQLHYHRDLSLSQLAMHVGLSAEHLVRLFHKYEHTTPMKYVWNYRVLCAQDLLVQTGLTIGEVASRCGFKTSYHFARIFKQSSRKTPSEFRSVHWNVR